jgi:hypothetical protein
MVDDDGTMNMLISLMSILLYLERSMAFHT